MPLATQLSMACGLRCGEFFAPMWRVDDALAELGEGTHSAAKDRKKGSTCASSLSKKKDGGLVTWQETSN